MTPTPPALRLDRVAIGYDATLAVSDVSLTVAPAEIHVLLGRSGSGKTTLLRAIAGFERCRSGSIHLGDAQVDGPGAWLAPERRGVGLVFQDYALFPHLSVERNVAFGARGDRAAEVERLLRLVGLGHRARAMPSELSGGEQQRVALARALAARPRLLLLDEPFSNLDPELRSDLREQTFALLRDARIPAVLVTHSAEEALATGDRISVLHRGALAQTAPPRELYERPRTFDVAAALGAVQRLAATRLGPDRARCALGDLDVGGAPNEGDGPAGLLLRPERLVVSAGPLPAHTVGDAPATVERARFEGDSLDLWLRLADSTRLHARCRPWELHVNEGDAVRVGLRPGAACWDHGGGAADQNPGAD